jgi:hypothetical protein
MEPLENSRSAPTARSYRHGQPFRRGAEVSQKSSLPFFVLIGVGVGLFAFGMMSFCLPDPFAKIAAREAQRETSTFPPPVFKPIEAAPPVAEILPPPPAPVTVTSIAPPVKAHPVRRAAKKSKATN